jgi:hypothetical protein
MVGGIHTRKSHRAVPWRDECGRERIEWHYLGKEGGRPCLVESTALSAGTLEEGLVLTQLSVGVQGVQVVSGGRDPLYAMRAFGISANKWNFDRPIATILLPN